ncbi:Elongation factor P [Galdieria sulphuraria]|uniref:Elongation factor EF-P n=1 Tax=Galdieria sulphuraria TaxID=130081 RepID=M2XF06_GALSU|nr:elongation factor EF-P [Galdieria sulphuraria]EME28582.1 elongation factor EF-P [Galdieria sulphuraria]GJD08541.1 Elongation factor P [Galdieria sulphuraria]|eukprot:XP_005705102.1 elongation factor EF-P [Galdieria sulphuraria]
MTFISSSCCCAKRNHTYPLYARQVSTNYCTTIYYWSFSKYRYFSERLAHPISWRLFPRDRTSLFKASSYRQVTAVINSNDIRPGTTILVDGSVHRVIEFLHVKPGKGAAFVRTKLKNLETGSTVEKTFRAGERIDEATLDKLDMQLAYIEGEQYVFMNLESLDEERISKSSLSSAAQKYLKEGESVSILKHNGRVLDLEIPPNVVLEVVYTEPGIKGNTAQGGTKPATLETGVTVNVPLFVETGDKVKVDTREDKYISRA